MDTNPRVLIVAITKDYLKKKCYESLLNQDYDNYSIMIHIQQPDFIDEDKGVQQSTNCAHNRERARQIALGSDSDYIFFIDSDIVIPNNTISHLMKQMTAKPPINDALKKMAEGAGKRASDETKHCIGGWYVCKGWYDLTKDEKFLNKHHWNVAKVGDNDVFYMFRKPQSSLIRCDMVCLGCVMVTRELLEQVTIKPGMDRIMINEFGGWGVLDESGDFSNQVYALGYDIFADGDIICEHLEDSEDV